VGDVKQCEEIKKNEAKYKKNQIYKGSPNKFGSISNKIYRSTSHVP